MTRNEHLHSEVQLQVRILDNHHEAFLLPCGNAALLPVTTAPWVQCRQHRAASRSPDSLKPTKLLSGYTCFGDLVCNCSILCYWTKAAGGSPTVVRGFPSSF